MVIPCSQHSNEQRHRYSFDDLEPELTQSDSFNYSEVYLYFYGVSAK